MQRVLILGAAGRDFHNFNVIFRGNSNYHVVAFTATQIPDIANRRYPAKLAGSLMYPHGRLLPSRVRAFVDFLLEQGHVGRTQNNVRPTKRARAR